MAPRPGAKSRPLHAQREYFDGAYCAGDLCATGVMFLRSGGLADRLRADSAAEGQQRDGAHATTEDGGKKKKLLS